jgi:hypothetical protein
MEIKTSYKLNREKQVIEVRFEADNQLCRATVSDGDPAKYDYSSYLHGDKDDVHGDTSLSLADCILAAHVHLGLIPPQNFDPIPCNNQH